MGGMSSSQALPVTAALRDSAALGPGDTSLKAAIRAFVYAVLFVVAMEGAIALARFGEDVTPIWVAAAVLAWALIASPTRDWPLIVGFATAAHILRAVYCQDQPATELVYLLANIGSPLTCAALMRWQDVDLDFEDRGAVLRFLLICGVAAPAVSALVVAGGSFVDSTRFQIDDLGVWFLADALSYVVFLPVFKSFASGGWRSLLAPAIRTKTFVLFGILIAALISEWFMPVELRRSFPTLLIPYLIFMVFELGMVGARGAIIVTTTGLLAYALFASEIGRRGLPATEYMFSVQIYLAAVVACILPLAAALAEKQRLYEAASDALSDAQSAWGELIAAEAHYRLVADNSRDMVMRVGLDGAVLFASPACRYLAADTHDLEGQELHDLVHPDDRARVQGEIKAFIDADMLDHPTTIRARLKPEGGEWRKFDIVSTLVASRGRDPEEIIAVLREVQA